MAQTGPTRVTPASANEPSYRMEGFVIQYPFRDARGNFDESRAGVRYSVSWSNDDSYPGPADCQIQLLDSDGHEVGYNSTEWDSLQERFDVPSFVPVAVEREPAKAEGVCAAGNYDRSAAYEFSGTTSEDLLYRDGIAITATARWTSGNPPLTQNCEARMTHTDGTYSVHPFTLSTPEGENMVLTTIPGLKASEVMSVKVVCRALGRES